MPGCIYFTVLLLSSSAWWFRWEKWRKTWEREKRNFQKMTNAPIHTVTSFFNDWSKSVCVIFYYPSFFIRFALEMHQRNHTSRFVILHLERISSQSKKINEQIKFDCLAQWDIVKNYFITHKSTKSKFQTVIIIFVTLDTKLIDQCHKFYCSSGK